jgi:GT2 family glycosyltransferase
MQEVKLFAVVVTYNGMYWYDRCFTSLLSSNVPVQVIVIDNASSDGTVEFIKEKFPEITLFESKKNLGFGKANNIGIKYALEQQADFIFLLNQDAWVENDTLEELIRVSTLNPEYGILSPIHLNAEKTAIEQGMMVPLALSEHTPSEIISDFYLGLKKDIYDTNYVLAAAWLLPHKTIEMIGGFDPIFFHYGEDDNYLSRVIYHGLKVGIVPKVTICHDARKLYKREKNQTVTFDKWLLQRSTDLRYPDNQIDVMIKEYCKQAIVKFITFKRKTFLENYHNLMFLLRNKKSVLESRNRNKQKGRTWL